MSTSKADKTIRNIAGLAGGLSEEDTARAATELLGLAGVSRENALAFAAALGESDRAELLAQLGALEDALDAGEGDPGA
jgi:hypothetical protein